MSCAWRSRMGGASLFLSVSVGFCRLLSPCFCRSVCRPFCPVPSVLSLLSRPFCSDPCVLLFPASERRSWQEAVCAFNEVFPLAERFWPFAREIRFKKLNPAHCSVSLPFVLRSFETRARREPRSDKLRFPELFLLAICAGNLCLPGNWTAWSRAVLGRRLHRGQGPLDANLAR